MSCKKKLNPIENECARASEQTHNQITMARAPSDFLVIYAKTIGISADPYIPERTTMCVCVSECWAHMWPSVCAMFESQRLGANEGIP